MMAKSHDGYPDEIHQITKSPVKQGLGQIQVTHKAANSWFWCWASHLDDSTRHHSIPGVFQVQDHFFHPNVSIQSHRSWLYIYIYTGK